MSEQIITQPEALKLFFDEDIYLISNEVTTTMQVPSVTSAPVSKDYEYLGKNERQILILVNDPVNPVSTLEGRELLGKIVKAIQLNAKDFAVVNYASYPGDTFADFLNYFRPQLVLAFGVSPDALQLGPQAENTLERQADVYTIFSKELNTLHSDLGAKKALWASLKQLQLK